MRNRAVALHLNVTDTKNLDKQGVVEIDAVELVDGKEGEHFHTVINPQRPISRSATQYHGLSNNQSAVKNAPTFNNVALEFLKFVKDADVILQVAWTHHVLNMDLERAKEQHLIHQCRSVNYTYRMFKELHPEEKSTLGDIATFYKVDEQTESGKMVKVIQEMEQEKTAREVAALLKTKNEAGYKDQSSSATPRMFSRPSTPVEQMPALEIAEERSGLQPGHF